jgi:hypothetical protein
LRAEGFSCCATIMEALDKYIAIFDPKNIKMCYSCKFFPIFGHQNPGFGTESGSVSGSAIRKNAGSGSALNQCGSANRLITIKKLTKKKSYRHESALNISKKTKQVKVMVVSRAVIRPSSIISLKTYSVPHTMMPADRTMFTSRSRDSMASCNHPRIMTTSKGKT